MAPQDVMLDIETLALTPDALVLSIGAVKFDNSQLAPVFSETLLAVPDFMEQVLAGRRIEKSTQEFWRDLPEEASAHWRSPPRSMTVRSALAELSDFVREAPRIWANGIVFDIGVMEDLYRSFGLKAPWKYNAVRDARTIYDLMPELRGASMVGDMIIPHHPISDCKVQIEKLWMRELGK